MMESSLENEEPDRPKAYRLMVFEEAAGQLHKLRSDDGRLIAHIGGLSLNLPLELEDLLKDRIGERISLLRTDDPVKEYRIRAVR